MRLVLALTCLALLAAPAATATAPFTQWCGGSGESAADRTDAVAAFQIHVVYAVPAGGTDRFAQVASGIATDIASIDLWWRSQDATRSPRFDLASFTACTSTFGQLDISAAHLLHDAAYYAPNQYELLRDDLDAAGFRDPDKKYLVYYDGPPVASSADTVICGAADSGVTGGGPRAYSIAYLGGFCGATLGTGGPTTVIAAHELIHGLGALPIPLTPPGPPHACPGDPGHPCDSPRDVLSPSFAPDVTLDSLVLDVGRDDYYGHAGPWWDIRNSLFLAHLDSADSTPPTTPSGFTATSRGPVVTLRWGASTDAVGPVVYRVYRDGAFLARTTDTHYVDDDASDDRTYTYAVRAYDGAGFLSGRPELRFRVGVGIVDSTGRIVRDTVPPPPIGRIQARATRTSIVLSWRGVADPGGLRGYRILRNGRAYALIPQPSIEIPAAKARALWSVLAVDRAGNAGRPARILVR
jgi:hypothetical protein